MLARRGIPRTQPDNARSPSAPVAPPSSEAHLMYGLQRGTGVEGDKGIAGPSSFPPRGRELPTPAAVPPAYSASGKRSRTVMRTPGYLDDFGIRIGSGDDWGRQQASNLDPAAGAGPTGWTVALNSYLERAFLKADVDTGC
jgi:hypothetical protein